MLWTWYYPRISCHPLSGFGADMSGLYYLFFLIGAAWVIAWWAMNDRVPVGGQTRGVLRMNDASGATVHAPRPSVKAKTDRNISR